MTAPRPRTSRHLVLAGISLAAATMLAACTADDPIGVERVAAAPGGGGGGGGGKGPKVDSTNPPWAPQNTTLDVQVFGSGFANGSVVTFTIDGVPQAEVVTNSTTFVGPTEVVANITIAFDAQIDLYDVELAGPDGKKGVGADLFNVVLEGTSPEPIDIDSSISGYSQALDAITGSIVVGRILGTQPNGSGPTRGFYWTEAGGMVDIGSAAGPAGNSDATAINSAGQVAGNSALPNGEQHATIWTAGAGFQDLGILPGADPPASWASDINESSWVVGGAYVAGGATRCFLWRPATGMQDLGTLNAGDRCFADGMSDLGWVFGTNTLVDGESRAVLWTPADGLRDLGTLGGDGSQAIDVNNHGQVVGHARRAGSDDMVAFMWTEADGMVELGTLGGCCSTATAINDHGQVFGKSRVPSGKRQTTTHAFMWTQADGMVDLGAAGPSNKWSQAWGAAEVVDGVVWVVGNAEDGTAVLWKLDVNNLPGGGGEEPSGGGNGRGRPNN